MKSACFCFTVGATERPQENTFFEVKNSENPYQLRMIAQTFGAYLLKYKGERDFFSHFTNPGSMSEYQTTACGIPVVIPTPVSRKTIQLMPLMGFSLSNLRACKKIKLKQEAYEQLYSIKSYNIHYEEPEAIQYCQYPQWSIGIYKGHQ